MINNRLLLMKLEQPKDPIIEQHEQSLACLPVYYGSRRGRDSVRRHPRLAAVGLSSGRPTRPFDDDVSAMTAMTLELELELSPQLHESTASHNPTIRRYPALHAAPTRPIASR